VSDESQLQVTRKDDESSVVPSSARSSLAARGRRDAVLLTLHARAESEQQRSGSFPGWREPGYGPWYGFGDRPKEQMQKDAEQGCAPAQFHLGWMYDNPHLGVPGVGQDYVEAAKWYRKAAEHGHAPSQFNLGVMYDIGEGVGQDYVEAAKWYHNAAEQGLDAAQFNLGIKYENGEGIAQDSTKAATWYRKAAERGFSKAQFNLGLKYASGQGVAQDYVQAHMWMDLAAPRANRADGKKYTAARDRVAAKMNPMQIAEARRLALEWETNRRDESIAREGNLTGRCNKCGEDKALVFAGCVCARCSEALDRQWADSAATDWLVTRPSLDAAGHGVSDIVLPNTTYAHMKKYSWAANDTESRIRGFFRSRQGTPEEIVHLESKGGTWSDASGARIVRRATFEEVAAHKQNNREWLIASETDVIISDTCERLGIQSKVHWEPAEVGELDDPGRIQAAKEIAGRLRQLGWLEELAKMRREDSDALQAVDDARLLEMALQRESI